MIIFTLIVAAAALLALVAFVGVVLGIHQTERRYALRQHGYGPIDTFTRRLLGVYADPGRRESESAENERTRR